MIIFILCMFFFFLLLEYKVRTSLFLCAKKKIPPVFAFPSQLKRQQFVLSVLTEVRLWGQTVSSNNIALSSALKSIQIYLKKYTRKEKDLSASRRRDSFHRPCFVYCTVPDERVDREPPFLFMFPTQIDTATQEIARSRRISVPFPF